MVAASRAGPIQHHHGSQPYPRNLGTVSVRPRDVVTVLVATPFKNTTSLGEVTSGKVAESQKIDMSYVETPPCIVTILMPLSTALWYWEIPRGFEGRSLSPCRPSII